MGAPPTSYLVSSLSAATCLEAGPNMLIVRHDV